MSAREPEGARDGVSVRLCYYKSVDLSPLPSTSSTYRTWPTMNADDSKK